MPESRPGLAHANRARKGEFSRLIAQALEDPSALDALLFAYEALPTAERLRMAQAVVQDAEQPIAALAAMLSVEAEPALRAHLGETLREMAIAGVAFLSGTATRGELELIDVDRQGLRRVMHIAWAAHEITDLRVHAAGDSFPRGRATPRELALEHVAPMLWRYLRSGGALPPEAERFARYF